MAVGYVGPTAVGIDASHRKVVYMWAYVMVLTAVGIDASHRSFRVRVILLNMLYTVIKMWK